MSDDLERILRNSLDAVDRGKRWATLGVAALFVATLILMLAGYLGSSIKGESLPFHRFVVALIITAVPMGLTLAQPDVLGIRGAAIAQACTLTFSAIARLFLVKRFLGIWPFDGAWLRLAVPTALGALTMWLAHAAMPNDRWFLDLLVSAGAGTAVYAGSLLAFGLSPTERAAAIRLILRRPTAAAP